MFSALPPAWAAIAALVGVLLLPSRALCVCPDYFLSEEELSEILEGTLGPLGPFVSDRSVRVEPEDNSCYLRMRLAVGITALGLECTASACSTGVTRDRELGIRGFSISGCDPLFDIPGLSRNIPTVYTDVSDRLRAHCGGNGYRIERILPQRSGGAGQVRLILAPIP